MKGEGQEPFDPDDVWYYETKSVTGWVSNKSRGAKPKPAKMAGPDLVFRFDPICVAEKDRSMRLADLATKYAPKDEVAPAPTQKSETEIAVENCVKVIRAMGATYRKAAERGGISQHTLAKKAEAAGEIASAVEWLADGQQG